MSVPQASFSNALPTQPRHRVRQARAVQQAKIDAWRKWVDQLAAKGRQSGRRHLAEPDSHSWVRRARDQLSAATGARRPDSEY